MIDVNKLYKYIDQNERFDAECDSCSIEIIEKLGYEFEIYYVLKERFKESCYIYIFLDGCEKYKIDYDEALDFLNMPRGGEWDCVKNVDIKQIEFNENLMNNREYSKAYNLVEWIRKGEFDYYEKATYKMLEPETQKFVMYLVQMMILSAQRTANVVFHGIDRTLVNIDKKQKEEAINCWNFLETIK